MQGSDHTTSKWLLLQWSAPVQLWSGGFHPRNGSARSRIVSLEFWSWCIVLLVVSSLLYLWWEYSPKFKASLPGRLWTLFCKALIYELVDQWSPNSSHCQHRRWWLIVPCHNVDLWIQGSYWSVVVLDGSDFVFCSCMIHLFLPWMVLLQYGCPGAAMVQHWARSTIWELQVWGPCCKDKPYVGG